MRYLILFLLSFGFIKSNAQGIGVNQVENLNRASAESQGVIQTFDNRYDGVKGTPYLFNDFVLATVYLSDDLLYNNVWINYDSYAGNVLFKTAEHLPIRLFDLKKLQSFVIRDKDLTREFWVRNFNNRFQVVEKIYSDRLHDLVKIHTKVFVKADYQGAYSQNKRYDEFKTEEHYGIVLDGDLHQVKLSLKSVKAVFKDKEDAIEQFVENSLRKIRTEGDLIDILKFLERNN